MSLLIRDEKDNVVNDLNPIITEHNGTAGDILILKMEVENSSAHHYHKNVVIQVTSKFPVDVSLNNPTAPNPAAYFPRIEVPRLNVKEKHKFNLRTVVPANTKEQIVMGATLQVISLRFPTL